MESFVNIVYHWFISTVMPRKDRVLKQKKTVLKRAAEDHGQTKFTFSKIPRNDSDSPKKSGSAAVSLGENSIDQGAQSKETDDNDAHGQSISDEHDTSSGSNKDSPSTEVVAGTVEEDVSNQQQGIKRAHDLADIVLGKKSLTDLNRGNFLAIIDLIAKYDPIVKEHLKNGQRNAKMLSWKTQNDIIANAALVIRNQIKDMICSEQFYAVIGDEVTERFANKEVLLVCLRYLNSMNLKSKKHFFSHCK